MARKNKETEARNIEAVRQGLHKLSARDLRGYFSRFSPGFSLEGTGVPKPLVGIEASQRNLEQFVRMFPDLRFTIDQIFAAGESVAARFTATGTRTDGFLGLPPTDTPFKFAGVTINEFRNELRTATWQYWDNLALLQQIAPQLVAEMMKGGDPGATAESFESPVGPGQELLLFYVDADYSISKQNSIIYMIAAGDLRDYQGKKVGQYTGVKYLAGSGDVETFLHPPPPPEAGSLPIPETPVSAYKSLIYSFLDGSSVYVLGSTINRVTPFKDGATMLTIPAMGYIAGGTGRFEGASGIECSCGVELLSKGQSLAMDLPYRFNAYTTLLIAKPEAVQQRPPATSVSAGGSRAGSQRHSPSPAAETEMLFGSGIERAVVHQQGTTTYIAAYGEMYDLAGRHMGSYEGSMLTAGPLDPQQLMTPTPRPSMEMMRPEGIPEIPVVGHLKVTFTFADGTLTAAGVATAELVPLADGSMEFLIAAMAQVVGGSGRYAGATGIEAETGVAILPPGQSLSAGTELDFRTSFEIRFAREGAKGGGTATATATSRPSAASPRLPRPEPPAVPHDPSGIGYLRRSTPVFPVPAGTEVTLGLGIESDTRIRKEESKVFITAPGTLFDLVSGRPLMSYFGTMLPTIELDLEKFSKPQPMPPAPMDKPTGIPEIPVVGRAKTKFEFPGGILMGAGLSTIHVVKRAEGGMLFMLSAMERIAGGTGRYEGAAGIATATGIAVLSKSQALAPGAVLSFATSATLLVIPRDVQRHQASAGAAGRAPRTAAHSSAATSMATPASALSELPPGTDPDTYKLATVERLLRRIANFTFFSMPNAAQPNVPIMSGGKLIGVEVHEDLHRFEIKQKVTSSGFEIKNAVGQPEAQVHMHWRPIPDDFDARPGAEIPPTPLDPTRSQRFMMHDGHFSFDDSGGSGLRGFGSGRTFPVLVDGKPQLRLAAVVDVLEGLGEIAGHQGLMVVNGYIKPPDGLALCILLRLTDPSGDFAAKSRLPALRPLPHPDPDSLYLIFLGEPVPDKPVEMLRGADGRMLGAKGPQRMRLIDIVYDVKGSKDIRSKSKIGEIVGEMNADAWFDPTSGAPPFPFQTTGGIFSFFGRDGKTVGTVAADMVEGRALPTEMPGAPMPVFRVGGLAPVTSGTGCFRGAVGLFTIDSFISLVPNTISGLFVMHLSDPKGKLRKALTHAWR